MMTESPYTTPQTSSPDREWHQRARRRWGWAAVVSGGFVLIPLVSSVWSIIRVVGSAMAELERSGRGDPEVLAGEISVILLSIFWGVVFVAIASVALVICLMFYRKHRRAALRLDAAAPETGDRSAPLSDASTPAGG